MHLGTVNNSTIKSNDGKWHSYEAFLNKMNRHFEENQQEELNVTVASFLQRSKSAYGNSRFTLPTWREEDIRVDDKVHALTMLSHAVSVMPDLDEQFVAQVMNYCQHYGDCVPVMEKFVISVVNREDFTAPKLVTILWWMAVGLAKPPVFLRHVESLEWDMVAEVHLKLSSSLLNMSQATPNGHSSNETVEYHLIRLGADALNISPVWVEKTLKDTRSKGATSNV